MYVMHLVIPRSPIGGPKRTVSRLAHGVLVVTQTALRAVDTFTCTKH